MKFVRFQDDTGNNSYGWVLDGKVGKVEGDIFMDYRRLEADRPIDKTNLLPPVSPEKIICVAKNYASHAAELESEVPSNPILFLKPPSSMIAAGDTILIPPQSNRVDHEAELAVVIGKKGRWIQTSEAMDFIFGYTIANDVTARDLQQRDGQWGRAKGFDTFCPLGPWIETDLDPSDILITCKVNDEMRQMVSTREMVFTIPQLISFVSSIMTLNPGDVILTGTPAGIAPLEDGDLVEVFIEGIGSLKNPVKKSSRII